MYCSSCGIEVAEDARYCSQCGAPAVNRGAAFPRGGTTRVLSRPRMDKKIAGVCAGLGRYLGIDVTLARILMLVLALCPPGAGLIIYVVCWIVMPQDPILLPPASAPAAAQGAPVRP